MATSITVKYNQSMYDVIVQATGSIAAGMQFCGDNGVSITDVPPVGAVMIVSDAALALGDAGVLAWLRANNVTVGTMGSDAVSGLFVVDEGGNAIVDEDNNKIEP